MNTHHRIFEIDELVGLISRHLVSTHYPSAVSLACACRFLEEPALSSLWELQNSFTTLIGVLPIMMIMGEVCGRGFLPIRGSRCLQVAEYNNSGSAWQRFRRYATWMRRLHLREKDDHWMKADVFGHLLAAPTSGPVCPALSSLTCHLTKANQPFIPYFLSPHLTHLTIHGPPFYYNIPTHLLPDPIPILQALQTSYLQEVIIDLGLNGIDRLEDEISSMIQRCGRSLRVLSVPLGEAAVHHVAGLKNLRVWKNVCSPPPSTLPLSTTLPPLQTLTLKKTAYGWMPWFARRERSISGVHGELVEHAGPKATLTRLEFHGWVPIDATFTSPFFLFSNLAFLSVQPNCVETDDCGFLLTNQDVIQLSAALPRLEVLDFGSPCSLSTCRITVSSLLALSVHCEGLHRLKIHLNTVNLISDIKSLLEDPYLRDLGSLPTRCRLVCFEAGSVPFPHPRSDEDITTIAAGLISIFPSLIDVHTYIGMSWFLLRSRVRKLQGLPVPPPVPESP